jgi:hypothetical protein
METYHSGSGGMVEDLGVSKITVSTKQLNYNLPEIEEMVYALLDSVKCKE